MTSEIGRELKASEIRTGTIVVIEPPGRDKLISMHVVEVRDNLIVFYSGVLRWHVINLINADDQLRDDQNRHVRVFEYLGEV